MVTVCLILLPKMGNRTRHGLYQEAAGLTRTNRDEKWKNVVYWVFDSPQLSFPFEERMESIQYDHF